MSKKTTTELMRRAKTIGRKNEIMSGWMSKWENEQKTILDKLDIAVDIKDFDVLCMTNGSLREITKKKFDVLYRCLPILTGDDTICAEESYFYQWGKYQTGLIAILGRLIASAEYNEMRNVVNKLLKSTDDAFTKLKQYIPFNGVTE